MVKLNDAEISFIGSALEGLLCGVYSGIYVIYLKHWQRSKQDSDKKHNIVFYSICVLYVLSVTLCVADITFSTYKVLLSKPTISRHSIYLIEATLFGFSDFIAQSILIYRCWIVWGCNTRVVIVPSILAFAFLGIWLLSSYSSLVIISDEVVTPFWGYPMTLLGLALSLTVNALVTGLIVFRILKVFRQVGATSNDRILGANGGSKLRCTILIIIESGMALFSIQLARVVVNVVEIDTRGSLPLTIIAVMHEMLTGIIPTTIAVQLSMGLSLHNENAMEEVVMIGSVGFMFNHPNSVTETGSDLVVGQDDRDDYVGVQQSNDIDIIER